MDKITSKERAQLDEVFLAIYTKKRSKFGEVCKEFVRIVEYIAFKVFSSKKI